MKLKIFIILVCLEVLLRSVFIGSFMVLPINAEEIQDGQVTANSFQNIPYEDCSKIYNINKENLFYAAIGAVNSNHHTIEEIQTNNGYVIFSNGKNKYIMTVASVDKNNSILKISPCNNLYYFPPAIINDIYKYIDINKDLLIQ